MPKKEKIQKMFDGIAGDYDRLNHIMSLGIDRSWRRRAIKEIVRKAPAPSVEAGAVVGADTGARSVPAAVPRPARGAQATPGKGTVAVAPQQTEQISSATAVQSASGIAGHPAGQEILDIACGTGDFSIAIARAMAPGSRVTGLDLSEGMLAVMRAKLAAAGLEDRVACVQGDSEALPYADATFDCVTIAFGIRNFEHRETALREILRVLKPGGKLVILELSVPSNPVIRWFYKLYFTGLLPVIGGKISGDKAAYRYLPASVLNFPGRDEWMAKMRACGYAGVRHKAFTLGICRMYIGLKP